VKKCGFPINDVQKFVAESDVFTYQRIAELQNQRIRDMHCQTSDDTVGNDKACVTKAALQSQSVAKAMLPAPYPI
jgi:hypothetical protein